MSFVSYSPIAGALPPSQGGKYSSIGSGKSRPRSPTGISVVFAPLVANEDPSQPENENITEKMMLPLTPQSLSFSVQGNWTDSIYSLMGDERAMYAGAPLDTITFSGRLEPPAYYIKATEHASSPVTAAAVATGRVPVGPSGGVGLPVLTSRTPQARSSGKDVDVSVRPEDGAQSPSGYTWVDPADFCRLLRGACKAGEICRLIIGDQFGFNEMVSIRSFSWRVEDPDPDVINFDITIRTHRLSPSDEAKVRKKAVPHSYTSRAGDTLSEIAYKVYGDRGKARTLWQLNRRLFERLYLFELTKGVHSGKAAGPYAPYIPADDAVGFKVRGEKARPLGEVPNFGTSGLGPHTYLDAGIKLVCKVDTPTFSHGELGSHPVGKGR